MNKNSTTRLVLALVYVLTLFTCTVSSVLLLLLDWTWLSGIMYVTYIMFAMLVTIMAAVKTYRAYTEYDTTSIGRHTDRMLSMSYTLFVSILCWFIIFAMDYTNNTNNAALILVFLIGFTVIRCINEWFVNELETTTNGSNL